MLQDRYLADLPIVIAAIDPCFSCTDRVISVRQGNDAAGQRLSWSSLREQSIDWYRRQGIDFSQLNQTFRMGERKSWRFSTF